MTYVPYFVAGFGLGCFVWSAFMERGSPAQGYLIFAGLMLLIGGLSAISMTK